MNYKDKTKEQPVNESSEPQLPIEVLGAKGTNHRQAEFVSNVCLVDHRRNIFIWENNK